MASNPGPLGLFRQDISAAFTPEFSDVQTDVTVEPISEKAWRIFGRSTQGDELVAEFSRLLIGKSDGVRIARHARIMVEPAYRYQGYSRALLQKCFPFYRKIGVTFVDLVADEDGPLVWAGRGWSLHGEGIRVVHDEIEHILRSRGWTIDETLPIFGPDVLVWPTIDPEGESAIGQEALIRLSDQGGEIPMRLYFQESRPLETLYRRDLLCE